MWRQFFPTSVSITATGSDARVLNIPKGRVLRIIEFFLGTCSISRTFSGYFLVRNKFEIWRKLFPTSVSLTVTGSDAKVLNTLKKRALRIIQFLQGRYGISRTFSGYFSSKN